MNRNSGFKVAALAASIALAMGSSAAFAQSAAPAANALPGKGYVTTGDVTSTLGTSSLSIQDAAATGGANVIQWGKNPGNGIGQVINASGTGGFNVGSAASVNFVGAASGGSSFLNIDNSGRLSQIFGTVTGDAPVYVANANGVLVGAGASINLGSSTFGIVGSAISAAPTVGDVTTYTGKATDGDVTVAKGASITASTILVAGGNNVNVDLSALNGAATLAATAPAVAPATASNAALNVSGQLAGGSIASFTSTGSALNAGTLDLSGLSSTPSSSTPVTPATYSVAGTLSNQGELTLPAAVAGSVYNTGDLTVAGNATFGGKLNNAGIYNGSGTLTAGTGLVNSGSITGVTGVTVSAGGLTNSGELTATGPVTVSAGGLTNDGQLTTTGAFAITGALANTGSLSGGAVTVTNGSLTNGGQLTSTGGISVDSTQAVDSDNNTITGAYSTGNNIVNNGQITVAGGIDTANGSINNHGTIKGVTGLSTDSTSTVGAKAAANTGKYGINNDGSITFADADEVGISANGEAGGTSTGSFTNSGALNFAAGSDLNINAANDISLAGQLTAGGDAVTRANPLGNVSLFAGGQANLMTPVGFTNANIRAQQVNIMQGLRGADGSTLNIAAGPKTDGAYSVRVASGVIASADTVNVGGITPTDAPNVILQGTLQGNTINLGSSGDFFPDELGAVGPVSDVFSGPNGLINVTGAAPELNIAFTGAVKNAPYTNSSDFHFNYLPVAATDGTLHLDLTPVAYTTAGTANGSAANILVNGNVQLSSFNNGDGAPTTVGDGDSAVTGVTNVPNTHLVLQATGNIGVGQSAAFYWPGYVYLGTIDGAAGTVSADHTIRVQGAVNNVLPGSVDGGEGITFMTQSVDIGGGATITTNANSWLNFYNDAQTQSFSNGDLPNTFYGGKQGPGKVVNYGDLEADSFHTTSL